MFDIVGATEALIEGMIGGSIGGKLAGYICKKCSKVVKAIAEKVGEAFVEQVKQAMIDSVFGDKPFSWKGFGTDLASKVLSSFYPTKDPEIARNLEKATDDALSNLLQKIIDVSKPWNDKLQACLSD